MRREWKVMLAVYFAGVAVVINQFKVPPAMDILLSELNLTMVQGGWLMSVFGISGVFLSVPAAMILERLRPKISGIIALTFTIIGSLIGALSVNITIMLLGRIIEGLGSGLIAVVAPTVIAVWFPLSKRGLPMGIWASWRPLGITLMFNMANPLIPVFGWRGIWWFGILVGLIALIIFAVVVSEPPAADDMPRGQTPVQNGLNLAVFTQPGILLLGLAIGGTGFAHTAYSTWAPSYFIQVHNISLASANFLTSFSTVLTIFSTVMTGWVIDKTKRPDLILTISSVLSLISYGFAFLIPSKSLIVPLMVMLGFFPGFLAATVIFLAPTAVGGPHLAGYAMAMVSIMTNLGSVFGPPALGALVSSTGGTWWTGTIPLVGALLVSTVASIAYNRISKVERLQVASEKRGVSGESF